LIEVQHIEPIQNTKYLPETMNPESTEACDCPCMDALYHFKIKTSWYNADRYL